jgi:tetratricopeptide (TPR) repeat protein
LNLRAKPGVACSCGQTTHTNAQNQSVLTVNVQIITNTRVMKRFPIQIFCAGLVILLMAFTSVNAQTYEDAVIAFNEASELAQKGNHLQAIGAYERVITISGQIGSEGDEIKTRAQNQIPQLYFIVARDLFNAGQLLDAAEAFQTAAEEASRFGNAQIAQRSLQTIPRIFLAQGNQYLRIEQFDQALDMYDRALAALPAYAAAYYQKGLVYRQQENLEDALSYFDRAIQVGRQSGEADIVGRAVGAARNFLLVRGVEQMENNRTRPATQLLRQALEYDQENAELHYRLAEVYNKQALWANAIEHANKSLQLEQGGRADRAKIFFELGYALKNQGNDSAACDAFSNAAFGSFRAAAEHAMEHELKCAGSNRR